MWLLGKVFARARATEAAFRESEQRYRSLVELAPDAIIVHDGDKFVFANEAAARMHGASSPEDLLGRNWLELIHPDERAGAVRRNAEFMASGSTAPFVMRRRLRLDGSEITVQTGAAPVSWNGRPAILGMFRDVTEQQNAQGILRESEERYRTLAELSPDAIVVRDDVRFLFANGAAAELHGVASPDDLVGREWLSFVHPDERGQAKERLELFLGAKKNLPVLNRRRLRVDGSVVNVEVTGAAIFWRDRPAFLLVLKDITERLRAEELIRISEERYRSLVENGSDWVWEIGADGTYTYVSPRGEEILGYRTDELIGKRPVDFSPPERVEEARKRWRQLVSERRSFQLLRNPRIRKDGSIVTLETSGMPISGPLGEFRGYRGISRDVTERENAAKAIRRSEAQLRQIIDLVPHMIFARDGAGRYLLSNRANARLYGMEPEEIIGKSMEELPGDPEEAKRFALSDQRIFDGGKSEFITEQNFTTSEGKTRIIQTSKMPFAAYSTNEPAVIGVSVDITERKMAEDALRESEQRYRDVVEFSPDAILLQEGGRIVFANSSGATLYGAASADDLIGVEMSQLIHRDELATHFDRRKTILETGMPLDVIEQRHRRLDGSEILVESRGIPVAWQGRSVILGMRRDITARKEAEVRARLREAELRLVQRLSSMGQVSASLAHELNQPLAAIMGYVQASRRLLRAGPGESPEKVFELLENATKQTDRAGEIIRRVRGFVERRELVRAMEDLNEVIVEACEYALPGAGNDGIDVKLDLARGVPSVLIDRVQVQQVIVNLVRNGIEAMESSGTRELTVRTAGTHDGVVISVHDTGSGIERKIVKQLFEPFVTTKSKGMGFGLSISRSIVEAHGGKIWAEQNRGAGTTFNVELPAELNLEVEDAGRV